MDKEQAGAQVFGFFNEIGIVSQLASALFTRLIPLVCIMKLHLSDFLRVFESAMPLESDEHEADEIRD